MKNIKTICLAAAVSALVFASCKTKHEKKAPPPEPKKQEIAFVQVADRAQMSYNNLKFTIFMSDGTSFQSVTDIEGRAIIQPNPYVQIVKIAYDFTDYRRPDGRLLAKEDFKFAKKLKTRPNSNIQEFELNFTAFAGAKTVLILDMF